MQRIPLALALVVCTVGPAAAQQGAGAQTAAPGKASPRTVWPDEGPRTWAPRPTVPAITANDLRTRLYQIADDSMLGRRVGELGDFKATAYIASEFRRLGLKPAGDNGTYFQDLAFGPMEFDRSQSRLLAAGSTLAAARDWIPLVPNAANGLGLKPTSRACRRCSRAAGAIRASPSTRRCSRARIAVFTASAAEVGLLAGARAAGPVLRCDSVPDKFGADAAATRRGGGATPAAAGGAADAAADAVARATARAESAGARRRS